MLVFVFLVFFWCRGLGRGGDGEEDGLFDLFCLIVFCFFNWWFLTLFCGCLTFFLIMRWLVFVEWLHALLCERFGWWVAWSLDSWMTLSQ